MKIRNLVALALVAMLWAASPALAIPLAADPCGQYLGDGGYKALSAPITITSSTALTQIVALTAGYKIYACTWMFSISGTNPTYQWSYGTGSACGTGNNVLTGVVPQTTATMVTPPAIETTQLVVPAGNALCLQLGGTTPGALGHITYRVGP